MSLTTEQLLDRMGVLGEELLAANRHLLARLDSLEATLLATASGGVSSVELEQNSKSINVKVKAYCDSPIQPAGDAALAELERQINLVRAGQARDWAATVNGTRAERLAGEA